MALIEKMETQRALDLEVERLREVSDDPANGFLWYWSAPQGLVVPRKLAVKPQFAEACEIMAEDGWPVTVRATGGDVTPMGQGIVCVSIVYGRASGGPVEIGVEYDKLCAPMEETLGTGASRGWMPNAFCDGEYNVQLNGKKFAGTAMRFRPCRRDKTRYAILAHALMLTAPVGQGAIMALNRFLEIMDEPRTIVPEAHTSLQGHQDVDAFLDDLKTAYARQYSL